MPKTSRCNIELKARIRSLDEARRVAHSLATERLDDQHQVDTYFNCPSGRLKLREINGTEAQLIAYHRPDQTQPKASHYFLIPVADPAQMKQALTSVLGVRVVVDKQREISLYHNVRIHLDTVKRLGTFLEFEAVLEDAQQHEAGQQVVEQLKQRFAIADHDLLTGSYADMLEQTHGRTAVPGPHKTR